MRKSAIFSSFTDIYFLKYVTKIFCISYYFQETIWECFKVQLSVAVSVYISLSKGASQLEIKDIQKIFKETFLLKLWSSNIFPAFSYWKFAEVLGQHLKA